MRDPVRRSTVTIIAIIVLIILGIVGWRVFIPGPMAFASGSVVALSDYHAANPTGVPADLAGADAAKRGEYLARAADCLVCHTAPGGKDFAGGLAIPLPFGTLYSTNIRRTSRPIRTLASAITAIRIFSTRCSAAYARMGRGFIRQCRIPPTPT
jgi:hypothetical protein